MEKKRRDTARSVGSINLSRVVFVVKAPKSEGVVDPKSGERRLVSLLLSGSRGRKSAPKGDSSRCVWRKQTAMSVRDNL
ncbi:hypothetical protein TNCV_110671 [Trichonephila clavipes]|nr:hypothetical protein TNCV_110671 [Trichonephila clavipes]